MKKAVVRPPNLRRAYFESCYGQLHCRTGFPSSGGFDELTSLVALHDAPGASADLAPLLPLLGADRSVYLPDLPGSGHSDGPPAPVPVGDYAVAIGEMLRSLRLRQIDLFGIGAGAAIALELALWGGCPIRRVVLAELPLEAPAATPPGFRADGSHLVAAWCAGLAPDADPAELERYGRAFGERLAGGASSGWPQAALTHWSAAAALGRLTLPALVLAPPGATRPSRATGPTIRVEPLLDPVGFGPRDLDRTVRTLRAFLDR